MKAFLFLAAYILAILGVNIGFSYVPMIETSIGLLSPMALVVGAIFVIRDFAQRYAGHSILGAMAIGAVLSYMLADPFVAMASVYAFVAAEGMDYLLYTFTKRPFHERVLWSSAVSTPVDTIVFLVGIGGFTTGTFVLMVISKMVAAVIIWAIYSKRADRSLVDEHEKNLAAMSGLPNPHANKSRPKRTPSW